MRTNKGRYIEYKALSFGMYVLPLLILFAVENTRYLKTAGTSLSFFGYVIMALILVAFKDKIVAMGKKNVILSVSIVIFVISAVMRYLADELLLISGVSLFGALMSTVVEPVADVYKARADRDKIGEGDGTTLSHKNAWRLAYGFREEEEERKENEQGQDNG